MQGRKTINEKLFYQVQLSTLVPLDNFYRRLNKVLDLSFLYKSTKKYYGTEGKQSIDPIVFFKICLVGYLNNIISDRKLIEYCSDSLSIRLFIGYDIDEKLPWHSTISRTRQLFDDDVFHSVFKSIVSQCVDAGLVAGHTQVIDSALVKANASMESLERKAPSNSLEVHMQKVAHESNLEKDSDGEVQNEEEDLTCSEAENVQASKNELSVVKGDNKKSKKNKKKSNKTHFSPTDPDARISVKPGKVTRLNYYSQISVDTSHQIITQMQADLADQKDSQCLQSIISATVNNLKDSGVEVENILADANYSSGENYAWLESQRLKSYIPPHGKYKGGPEGFSYVEQGDYWLCQNNVKITFRGMRTRKTGNKKRAYYSKRKDCSQCPFKTSCLGKSKEKRIEITAYKAEYDRNIERLNNNKVHKALRMKIVEPVFGTLINSLGMSKVNTRGLSLANKCMLLSATAFNIKKLLKHASQHRETMSNVKQILKKELKLAANTFKKLLFCFVALFSDLIRKTT